VSSTVLILTYIFVLILLELQLYLSPHSTVYVSSYYCVYICPRTTVYMCAHASVYIFVFIRVQKARERVCYICVLILVHIFPHIAMCPHTAVMCPHNRRTHALEYHVILRLALLYMRSHTTVHCVYKCPDTTVYIFVGILPQQARERAGVCGDAAPRADGAPHSHSRLLPPKGPVSHMASSRH
jgi:hypothetical protein